MSGIIVRRRRWSGRLVTSIAGWILARDPGLIVSRSIETTLAEYWLPGTIKYSTKGTDLSRSSINISTKIWRSGLSLKLSMVSTCLFTRGRGYALKLITLPNFKCPTHYPDETRGNIWKLSNTALPKNKISSSTKPIIITNRQTNL